MITETIGKFKEAMEAIGAETLYLQGDNTNFYYDGNIKSNAIIFDDQNSMCWGIRTNDAFPDSRYRITAFEYDTIQYLSMNASVEQVHEFLKYIKNTVTDTDVDTLVKKFQRHEHDKGWKYNK